MQNSAESGPDVSIEAGICEPFLHTHLPCFLLVWAVLAACWRLSENFFSKVLASVATDYWLVTTHGAEDVLQREKYKNSQAAPWGNRKKRKKMSKSYSSRGRAVSTVHFGSWYGKEVYDLWFQATGSPFRYFI